jgi:hypothetical protein
MARSHITDDDSGFLDALPARNRLKRWALLIAIPAVVSLVLLLILWNTFFKYVPPGKMLVVVSKSGSELDADEVLAKAGQKGIMREVLGEGWHFVMPVIYTTELKENVAIAPGKIGIVTARGGHAPAGGRVLAEKSEKGIQREVLLPGSYRLNPYGYEVKEVPMVRIDPGFVGVLRRRLTSSEGKEGIIKDRILQPGIYPLNTDEYEVIACEIGVYQTTYQYLGENKSDTAIRFPAKDGSSISLDCTIEWEVKPEFWPGWVAKFGTLDKRLKQESAPASPEKFGNLKNIEQVVIDQHVRKICRDRGFNYGAEDFLEGDKREKFQADFRAELDKVCKEDNVVVRSAFLRNIILPPQFLEQKRLERLAVESKITNEALTLTAVTTSEVAKAKQTIQVEVGKVEAETKSMVAQIERETQTVKELTDADLQRMRDEFSAKVAVVNAEKDLALGEAEAEARTLKDTAESAIYKMRMELFGRDGDAFLRYTMAKEMNPNLRLRLFQSGPGTLWTNMGDKSMNLFMPLPAAEKKAEK